MWWNTTWNVGGSKRAMFCLGRLATDRVVTSHFDKSFHSGLTLNHLPRVIIFPSFQTYWKLHFSSEKWGIDRYRLNEVQVAMHSSSASWQHEGWTCMAYESIDTRPTMNGCVWISVKIKRRRWLYVGTRCESFVGENTDENSTLWISLANDMLQWSQIKLNNVWGKVHDWKRRGPCRCSPRKLMCAGD